MTGEPRTQNPEPSPPPVLGSRFSVPGGGVAGV
jgi:hypothetical protein